MQRDALGVPAARRRRRLSERWVMLAPTARTSAWRTCGAAVHVGQYGLRRMLEPTDGEWQGRGGPLIARRGAARQHSASCGLAHVCLGRRAVKGGAAGARRRGARAHFGSSSRPHVSTISASPPPALATCERRAARGRMPEVDGCPRGYARARDLVRHCTARSRRALCPAKLRAFARSMPSLPRVPASPPGAPAAQQHNARSGPSLQRHGPFINPLGRPRARTTRPAARPPRAVTHPAHRRTPTGDPPGRRPVQTTRPAASPPRGRRRSR